MKKTLLYIPLILFTCLFMSCSLSKDRRVLIGTKWSLVKVNNKPTSESESGYGLSFDKKEMSGLTNCNQMNGSYSIKAGHIITRRFGLTEMYCEKANMKFENEYCTYLSSEISYSLNDDVLILKNNEVTLEYKKIK